MEASNTQENMGNVGPVIFCETLRACCKQDMMGDTFDTEFYSAINGHPRSHIFTGQDVHLLSSSSIAARVGPRIGSHIVARLCYPSATTTHPYQAVLNLYDRSKAHLAVQVWRRRQHRSLTFGPDLPLYQHAASPTAHSSTNQAKTCPESQSGLYLLQTPGRPTRTHYTLH